MNTVIKTCLFYLTAWLRVFDFKTSVLGYDITFRCGRFAYHFMNKGRVVETKHLYTVIKFDGNPYSYHEFHFVITKTENYDGVPEITFSDDEPLPF